MGVAKFEQSDLERLFELGGLRFVAIAGRCRKAGFFDLEHLRQDDAVDSLARFAVSHREYSRR